MPKLAKKCRRVTGSKQGVDYANLLCLAYIETGNIWDGGNGGSKGKKDESKRVMA